MTAGPVLRLYQPVLAGLLIDSVSVGRHRVLVDAGDGRRSVAEVLPATSVTVMPACDRPVPSLKVNGAGVVTPEVASLAT